MATRIENRRDARIKVIFDVRVRLLNECKKITVKKGYESISKIKTEDLAELREKVAAEVAKKEKTSFHRIKQFFGFRSRSKQLLQILDKALQVAAEEERPWFYYMDFSHYYTILEAKYPWMRSGLLVAILYLFLFYLLTPILFCDIMEDEGVCPKDPTGLDRPFYGWVSALYFASTTLSTVGKSRSSCDSLGISCSV